MSRRAHPYPSVEPVKPDVVLDKGILSFGLSGLAKLGVHKTVTDNNRQSQALARQHKSAGSDITSLAFTAKRAVVARLLASVRKRPSTAKLHPNYHHKFVAFKTSKT